MKDYIDVRNQKESMARSIVKRRNVVYMTPEQMERKRLEEQKRLELLEQEAAEQRRAEEALRRLEEQQRLEEQRKLEEIERLKKEQEEPKIGQDVSELALDRLLEDEETARQQEPE